MNLFKKELVIHVCRMNGEYEEIISNKTVIEHIFKDGVQRFAHMLFIGNPHQCSQETKIEPNQKEHLLANSGEYTIVETAGATVAAWQLASVILSVASAAYAFYVSNKYDSSTTDSTSSSNRSLTQRQNKERPMERIEDIAGTVRSYPTLIAPDYRKFNDDGIEVEHSLMCVGVGYYDINDVQDDETLISTISNAGAQFYRPYVMPGSANDAYYSVGTAFNEPVSIVYEASSVSGGEALETDVDRRFVIDEDDGEISRSESFAGSAIYWGRIETTNEDEETDDYGEVGDLVIINVDNLSGTYLIQEIGDYHIVISAPGGGDVGNVDSSWNSMNADEIYNNSDSAYWYKSDYLDEIWTDSYFLAPNDRESFWVNFTAESGLKFDSGKRLTIELEIEYAQANSSGVQTGPWISDGTFEFTGRTQSRIGITREITTSFTGPMLMRCRRVTKYKSNASLQTVYLDAMYGSAPIGVSDFGNVTTVQTRTYAKGSAANLSTRYFNCLASRELYRIQSDGSLSGERSTTTSFADYLAYCATSNTIGRRDQSEVNYQELFNQWNEVITYFGNSQAGEFSYTFDDNDISFQDTADAICGACFSVPIRKNGIISVKFEQPTEPRTLFNHRNKLPDSQTITRTFGNDDFTDGVEYQWVDPDNDDSVATIYIPSDNSALRPELVESVGVRNYAQAYWNAYRRYNKINNQRISIDDTVTSEGQLLSQLDVVAITDDTKSTIYAGEVIEVSGLTLTLNQPVEFTDGETHSITLRKRDGSIEIIGCSSGSNAFTVILDSTPSESPYTGLDEERTRFTFSADSDLGSDYYIISEIDRSEPNEISISGYNYSSDYYKNDTDTPEQ